MGDSAFRVMERFSNGLNPSVLTIRSPQPVGIVVRRSCRDRKQPPSYGRVAVIGMDELEPPLTGQTLHREAEIFHSPLIQEVQLAFRSTTPHKCRDRLDQESKLTFALAKRFFRALPVVDVGEQDVPSDDLTAHIAQRKPANLEPSIHAVETPYPFDDLVRIARLHRVGDDIDDAREIVGMNRVVRCPLFQLFQRLATVPRGPVR